MYFKVFLLNDKYCGLQNKLHEEVGTQSILKLGILTIGGWGGGGMTVGETYEMHEILCVYEVWTVLFIFKTNILLLLHMSNNISSINTNCSLSQFPPRELGHHIHGYIHMTSALRHTHT